MVGNVLFFLFTDLAQREYDRQMLHFESLGEFESFECALAPRTGSALRIFARRTVSIYKISLAGVCALSHVPRHLRVVAREACVCDVRVRRQFVMEMH